MGRAPWQGLTAGQMLARVVLEDRRPELASWLPSGYVQLAQVGAGGRRASGAGGRGCCAGELQRAVAVRAAIATSPHLCDGCVAGYVDGCYVAVASDLGKAAFAWVRYHFGFAESTPLPVPLPCPCRTMPLAQACWARQPRTRPDFASVLQWLDELIMEVPLEQHAEAAAVVGAAAAAAGGASASPPPAPGGTGAGGRVDGGRGMGRSSGDDGLVTEEVRRVGVAEGRWVRGGGERRSVGAAAAAVLPPFIAIDM